MSQSAPYAATRRVGASLPWADLPVVVWLLPGLGTLMLLVPAGAAFVSLNKPGLAAPLLWMQSLLLAFAAAKLVAEAHTRLQFWEGRAAPGAVHARVLAWLLGRLRTLAGVGLAGPLVLAAVLDSRAGDVRVLPGVLALMSASLCGGLLLSLSWRGQAPRWMALPAIGLVALALRPGGAEAVARGEPLSSLVIIGLAVLLAAAQLRPGALREVAPPLPQLRRPAWLRRLWLLHWHVVPLRVGPREYKLPQGAALVLAFAQPWFSMSQQRLSSLEWGHGIALGYALASHGLWLFFVGVFANFCLIAPPLGWRHRLAPGGLTAGRWALRLVLGSLLTYAGLLTLLFTVAVNSHGPQAWINNLTGWASLMGDALFAASFIIWRRASGRSRWDAALQPLALASAVVVVLAILSVLGITPQRGEAWLLVQAALTVPMVWLAIRAWARQDINALARSQ